MRPTNQLMLLQLFLPTQLVFIYLIIEAGKTPFTKNNATIMSSFLRSYQAGKI